MKSPRRNKDYDCITRRAKSSKAQYVIIHNSNNKSLNYAPHVQQILHQHLIILRFSGAHTQIRRIHSRANLIKITLWKSASKQWRRPRTPKRRALLSLCLCEHTTIIRFSIRHHRTVVKRGSIWSCRYTRKCYPSTVLPFGRGTLSCYLTYNVTTHNYMCIRCVRVHCTRDSWHYGINKLDKERPEVLFTTLRKTSTTHFARITNSKTPPRRRTNKQLKQCHRSLRQRGAV